MWNRLTLTLLLVASIARSSNSSSWGLTACPENCQCTIVSNASSDDEINDDNNNNNNNSIEVRCDGIPRIESIPENSQILVVRRTKALEIKKFVSELENMSNITDLRELAVINCSLTSFNVKLGRFSRSTVVVPISLNLSNNDIDDSQKLTILNGERLAELDLSRNRLTFVTTEAFVDYPRLMRLYLRDNFIGTVEKNAFAGLDRLESLDLSENRLGSLADDVFLPLCYLKSLNLSGNRLGILGQQLFENLGRLRQLDVSRNEQQQAKRRQQPEINSSRSSSTSEDIELSLILGSLQRLEMIDASRVGLERVPSALTRSVRSLNLAGNRLTTIRSGDFDSYPLLRVLDLSYNLITSVENDALGRLEIIEKLDLSGNRLSQLPQSLPSSLRRLILGENLIVKLERRDLEGLVRLESLVIDKNLMTSIEEGSMSQLSLLSELDVSDNPLERLPADTFGGPVNLASLRMSRLTLLQWDSDKSADMAFPVPAPERLVYLDLSESPALAAQLLADVAALSACKSLRRLDVSQTNLTELRSDLPYLLPQLRTLGLSGNRWKCTSDENNNNWLAGWIVEHDEIWPPAECTFENDTRILLVELPIVDYGSTTTTTTTMIVSEDFDGGSTTLKDSRGSSVKRRITTGLGIHPGIFILAGVTIGALALALSVVISRRRAPTFGEQLDRYEQRRPILTELW